MCKHESVIGQYDTKYHQWALLERLRGRLRQVNQTSSHMMRGTILPSVGGVCEQIQNDVKQ